jgi:hypothetical protein
VLEVATICVQTELLELLKKCRVRWRVGHTGYCNIMGPLSYMQSVVDRNVVMRHIPVPGVGRTYNFLYVKVIWGFVGVIQRKLSSHFTVDRRHWTRRDNHALHDEFRLRTECVYTFRNSRLKLSSSSLCGQSSGINCHGIYYISSHNKRSRGRLQRLEFCS